MDCKVLQKITQWISWQQLTIATGCDHGVDEVFNPTYTPPDAESCALFSEQKKFMFSVFSVTLKESSVASLYDTYAVKGETNYGDAQLFWHDLVTLFTSGQAGKALQCSLEREIDRLH